MIMGRSASDGEEELESRTSCRRRAGWVVRPQAIEPFLEDVRELYEGLEWDKLARARRSGRSNSMQSNGRAAGSEKDGDDREKRGQSLDEAQALARQFSHDSIPRDNDADDNNMGVNHQRPDDANDDDEDDEDHDGPVEMGILPDCFTTIAQSLGDDCSVILTMVCTSLAVLARAKRKMQAFKRNYVLGDDILGMWYGETNDSGLKEFLAWSIALVDGMRWELADEQELGCVISDK
ncbi:hypothetical protein PMIN02_001257 [Paraphaeosphaeria minitans]